jgi:uncharacterized membrane protein (UPF0127 family)
MENELIHLHKQRGFKSRLFLLMIPGFVFLAVLGLYLATLRGDKYKSQTLSSVSTPRPKSTIQIGQTSILVELANTPGEQALGLGERDYLPENGGMLFSYAKKTPVAFWMKGMRFPLDIIWIEGGRVTQITANIPPEPGEPDDSLALYTPNDPVEAVLEVNAGFAERNNIKVGDSVQMQSYP